MQVLQLHIQHKAEERLEKQSLQTIEVALHNVQWEKLGKEINIEGELFDVKSFFTTRDKIVLRGLWDRKETIIRNLLKKQAGSHRGGIIHLLLLSGFFSAVVFYILLISFRNFFKRIFCTIENNYLHTCSDVLAPPPWQFPA